MDAASVAAPWYGSATAWASGSRDCSTMPDTISVPLVGGLIVLAIGGLIPLFIVTMTGFLKISVVMFLIRNALGIQQTPPSLVLYGVAIILTVYVTSPLLGSIYARLNAHPVDFSSVENLTAMA